MYVSLYSLQENSGLRQFKVGALMFTNHHHAVYGYPRAQPYAALFTGQLPSYLCIMVHVHESANVHATCSTLLMKGFESCLCSDKK